ncbi:MAG: hypothetical protein ABI378_11035 [Chitinophagaceae bacterium]
MMLLTEQTTYIKCFIVLFSIILLTSCFKEDATTYHAYLKNETNHSIMILPYKSGRVLATDTIPLISNEEIVIAEGSDRGVQNHSGFFSNKLGVGSNDSIVVVFDGQLRVVHYINPPVMMWPKSIKYESTRNLGNYLSYDYSFKDINKHVRQAFYHYTFADADYEFAQH